MNGSPSSTAVSPTVLRVEDLGCIGIVVRSTQGGVEAAVPSGAATPGMPHADAVEVSWVPGSYSGASGDFVAVNLVELTGDSSDRLELIEEIPVELMGFDENGRLSLPPQLLEVSHAQLRPYSAPGAAAASSAVKKGKFKEGGREPSSKAAHAQRSSTPHRQRLPGAHGRSPRGVQRTTLSARYGRKGSFCVGECASRLFTETSGTGLSRLCCWGLNVPSVLGQSAPSFTGSSAAWGRNMPWRHRQMHGPDFRPSCQATHFSARRKLPVSAVLSCVSQTHWNRNTALLGQSTTLRAKPSNREFTGGIRCHFRRSVLSRGVWSFQAWRTGADGEGGENPQGETRGHSSSRKQDAQIFECPRWRGMVLAQTRRRVPVAAMRQLPQPHPVRRHYRCGPRRGKVGKPAESNCSSSHLRCAGIGVAGSIPRNGMGMAQGPCLAPWAAGQSAMIAYHKERVTLDAARKTMGWLWSDRFRRKRAERRPHQEGGPRRNSTAEMRMEARGRAPRRARKARNDQARQGPARASSGASPVRHLKESAFRRLGSLSL